MKKSEFVSLLKENFPPKDEEKVNKAFERILDYLSQNLAEGKRVELRGLGSFGTREHTAHIGRNPRTGETVSVKAKKVPYFRAGKELRQRVNGLYREKDPHCE